MRVAIDDRDRGGHSVAVSREGDVVVVELLRPSRDSRSGLHAALAREIVVSTRTAAHRLEGGRARIANASGRLSFAIGDGGAEFAEIEVTATSARLVGWDPVSPFETRFLADNGRPHPAAPHAARVARAVTPTTDLHTHFAACVGARELVEIGARTGVTISPAALAAMGASATGHANTALAELPDVVRARVAEHLSIPADRQTTFAGLEEVYARRAPITKHLPALPFLLRAIARDYAAMGVRYAELSLYNIIEAATLRLVHAELPAIEREHGVSLRFLVAMHRMDDLEWDLDMLERIAELRDSRYIVGVDFMGHETNSTRAFAPQLRAACAWATKCRPGFVVRVHAGESPAFPENVRVALEETVGADIELRIGHGLYGVDDHTLDEIVRRGVIVEFNLNSNYALNNVQSAREVPLLRYLARGVPVVLGTDGYGIYETTTALEARTARLFGVTDRDLLHVRATEDAYLARRLAHDADLPATFDVPKDRAPTHYTPEIMARAAVIRVARDAELAAKLDAIGAQRVAHADLAAFANGRAVVAIAGAWRKSWDALGPAAQARITTLLEGLFAALDPANVLVVAGGTRDGVEGTAQRIARERGFHVLGAITASTPPDGIDPRITHASIVSDSLYDKAGRLYPALRELDAACLFFGGGGIVSDEIQTAENLRARVHLLADVEGASAWHAREQTDLAFSTVEQLIAAVKRLPRRIEPLRYVGPNPAVSVALVRTTVSGLREVLLVLRSVEASCEAGRWALPGGFIRTAAEPGHVWLEGLETMHAAARRQLTEETGVDLGDDSPHLVAVGVFERGGRDPRDTSSAWSRSHAFTLELQGDDAPAFIASGDDASDARWHTLDALPKLAFDHIRIVEAAVAALGGSPRIRREV